MVFAPGVGFVLDVLGRDEAGDGVGAVLQVGRVGRGDAEGCVEVALGVVGVEEVAGHREGVAGHDGFGGVEAAGCVEVGLLDGVGFVDDEQQFWGVEALDALGLVGCEGDGESVG